MLQGKTLYGRVALSVKSSQSIWLDPAEQRVTLAGNVILPIVHNYYAFRDVGMAVQKENSKIS